MSDKLLADQEQKAVIQAPLKQNIMLIAGAGSGKTFTICSRVAYILSKEPNAKVLLFSFTNQAVQEIKNRVLSMMPNHSFDISAYTLHGYAYRFLLNHDHSFNVKLKPVEENGKKKWLENLHENELINYEDVTDLNKIYKEINLIKAGKEPIPENFQVIIKLYDDFLKQNQLFEFDDLIKRTEEYLKNTSISVDYDYIMVDEAQDLNIRQIDMLLALQHKTKARITLVGDDDQAIYGFRGSYPRVFKTLSEKINLNRYTIATNYRSSLNIIKVANCVTQLIKDRFQQKTLVSDKGDNKVLVSMYCNYSKDNCAEWIAKQSNLLIKQGVLPGNIAVLYRYHVLADFLIEAFEKEGIEYDRLDSKKRKLPICIGFLIDYLTIVNSTNLDQEEAVINLVHKPKKRSITKKSIKSYGEKHNVSHWNAILALAEENKAIAGYRDFIYSIRNHVNKTILEQAQLGIEELNLQASECHLVINALQSRMDIKDLSDKDFLINTNAKIKFNTIHSAKGLEWDYVFLLGCTHARYDTDLLRLMYVGVTRARQGLFLVVDGEPLKQISILPKDTLHIAEQLPNKKLEKKKSSYNFFKYKK